jgi:hypothetical protein
LTPNQLRGQQIYLSTKGSEIERLSVMAIGQALESPEVTKKREQLNPESQLVFMMVYECGMMWAIFCGMEKRLNQEIVTSVVEAMRQYVMKNGWYKEGAFEKIWAALREALPRAFVKTKEQNAIFPYEDMMIAAQIAGYPVDDKVTCDPFFANHTLCYMMELMKASMEVAKDYAKKLLPK